MLTIKNFFKITERNKYTVVAGKITWKHSSRRALFGSRVEEWNVPTWSKDLGQTENRVFSPRLEYLSRRDSGTKIENPVNKTAEAPTIALTHLDRRNLRKHIASSRPPNMPNLPDRNWLCDPRPPYCRLYRSSRRWQMSPYCGSVCNTAEPRYNESPL